MAKYSLLWITLVIISAVCCNSGLAQNPAETFTKALTCFNDKYIYSSCNEAYRLTQSGNLNVPAAATNQFCYGPCLAETHLVLDCIDRSLSTFVFYNKATLNDVRLTLQAACGHTDQRGNFNVGEYMQDYMQDEWSSADVLRQSNLLTFILAISVVFFIVREAL